MADLRGAIAAAVRHDGRQRNMRCPAHDDQRSSLSVGRGDDGRAMLHCHAGCATDAVLEAAGLSWADLHDDGERRSNGNGSRQIIATYDYTDEQGTLLYQAVRTDPKGFFQRRPDGKSWINTLGTVRRVLFGVRALLLEKVVYVAEGEKDVLALRAVGVTATCNAGGAGKWREEYTQQLQAASVEHVVILPDNDDPGRQHAETIARSCHAAGLRVTVLALPDLPPKGDISDWIAAGHTRGDLDALVTVSPVYQPAEAEARDNGNGRHHVTAPSARSLHVTRASDIRPRPVHWLWLARLACGTLNLIGGREGIGKSIFACWLAAAITRGRLPGAHEGAPRAVIIAATEDSWEYTIVPRLMAAGADLTLVYRVDVETADGGDAALSLPRDLPAFEALIRDRRVAATLFDPILSRLDAGLDSHKDGEVRQALEPLVSVLERTGCTGLGLIHVNKSTSTDPLTTLMASRAFAAVARAVLFVMVDPDDEQTRLLGQPKNNLGRSDLPTLAFQISGTKVADTDEGPVWTGQLHWTGESDRSIRDALQQTVEARGENRTVVSEAADWLQDYLASKNGSADSAEVKHAGMKAGHTKDALHRARTKLQIVTISVGFPRRTHWMLSSVQSSETSGETTTTTTTQTTTANHTYADPTTGAQLLQSSELSELSDSPRATATTAKEDNDGAF